LRLRLGRVEVEAEGGECEDLRVGSKLAPLGEEGCEVYGECAWKGRGGWSDKDVGEG
jgi:hypothetical protein